MQTNHYADPEMIRHHGDDLERHFAEEIINRIPAYATFWATYVGNNGTQGSLAMPGKADETHTTRDSLWQYLYTLFESLALCWSIESEFLKRECISSTEDYLRNLNAWTAFYAHLGRIHDMAEKATTLIDETRLFAPFDPFYEQRHIALHGIKVPMRWADKVLCAPPLGEKARQWNTQMSWKELDKSDFEDISSPVSSTLRELEIVISNFISAVLQLADSKLGLRQVIWPASAAPRPIYTNIAVPMAATQSSDPISHAPHGISGFSGLSVVDRGNRHLG